MNVRNCRYCGRIFNYVLGPLMCPVCKEEREAKFQDVKKYVQDNRNTSINEVARECEVEVNQINQWIREDRLQFADDSPIRVSCEKCGAMIRSGRFCNKCKADMTNALESAYAQPVKPEIKKEDKKDKDRMRFLDK